MNEIHTVKIITKFNRETKEGKLVWKINHTKPSSMFGSEVLVDSVYMASVLDKNLRLYCYQYKNFYAEDSYEWSTSHRLEFVDSWGNAEWTFPYDKSIYDLYETVRFKTSNVEKFIDNYLTDDEKKDEHGLRF